MEKKKIYIIKKTYTLFANAVIITSLLFMFRELWYRTFNDLLDRQYVERGNLLIFFLYAVVTILFFQVWGGFKLGYNRLLNILLSQIFAVSSSNIFLWIEIVLLVAKMHEVKNITLCIIILTIENMLLCLICTIIFSVGYGKFFKPWRLLEIDGEVQNQITEKLKTREDKYCVCEKIKADMPWEIIKEKLEKYDAVVLNEVPDEIQKCLLKYCYVNSIRVYFTPQVTDIIVKGTEQIHLFDTPLLLSRNVGLTYEQMIVKRCFDIVCSVAGLIICSPIFLITALAIKIEDRGPILFSQERCTIHGKKFYIHKFRSMIVGAERDGEVKPAKVDDKRITSVGRILRKTHIDELPQLVNVLKGDMSIVGPRPERVEHVERYTEEIPEFYYRMKVKGGMTGYAQVYGKYNTSAYDKLRMDLQYIVNYSLILDIQIILETFKILFKDNNTDSYENLQ